MEIKYKKALLLKNEHGSRIKLFYIGNETWWLCSVNDNNDLSKYTAIGKFHAEEYAKVSELIDKIRLFFINQKRPCRSTVKK